MTLELLISGTPDVGDTLTGSFFDFSAPAGSTRFFEAFDWRFVLIDRASFATLTFLDKIAFNRTLYYELNAAAYATGDVSSDNPEVNIIHSDGAPFLSYNDRFLLGLRREGPNSTPRPAYLDPTYPWVPRFFGMVSQIQRQAQTDQPVSHYTAYDPLGYWAARPVVNSQGVIADTSGLPFWNQTGDTILVTLLYDAFAAHGSLYVDWGQTPFYGGTIETTDNINIVIQGAGSSLADAVKALTDTATMDVILTPIYDPVNRPGILAELNIYRKAGKDQNAAIFAWDMPSRSLGALDLLHDGTQMANTGTIWLQTANAFIPVQSDAPSLAHYGEWWLLGQSANSSIPSLNIGSAALDQALYLLAQVELQKFGRTTLSISPTPERSPLVWNDYFLGDNVPVYASDDFGEAINPGTVNGGAWTQLQRVHVIPITLADDSVETVEGMLLTYTNPPQPPVPPIALSRFASLSIRPSSPDTFLRGPQTLSTFVGPTTKSTGAPKTILTTSPRHVTKSRLRKPGT